MLPGRCAVPAALGWFTMATVLAGTVAVVLLLAIGVRRITAAKYARRRREQQVHAWMLRRWDALSLHGDGMRVSIARSVRPDPRD